MKRYIKSYNILEIDSIIFCSSEFRDEITASIKAKDIMKNMVRVKSSNIWSYAMNVRTRKEPIGDVYVQFKNERGGPGDVYVLYDVPITVYRKWQSAPSKGHFYWQYLRNSYKYSKLTGDRRGKLANAIN